MRDESPFESSENDSKPERSGKRAQIRNIKMLKIENIAELILSKSLRISLSPLIQHKRYNHKSLQQKPPRNPQQFSRFNTHNPCRNHSSIAYRVYEYNP